MAPGDADAVKQALGVPSPSPAPPGAAPMLGAVRQGLALDPAGRLSVVVRFLDVVTSDPAQLRKGQFWYRSDTSQLCICTDATTIKRVTLT